ncbi:MAG: protein kinase [Bryobacteraceae bacterium]|nr:protein kinase [Bryobacteraceae bacterium]
MRLWLLILALPALAAPGRVVEHPKPDFDISGIAEGADGMYLGGRNGLYRYDGFRYRAVEGYPFRRADAVHFTSDGVLWAGSEEEGLVRRGADGAWVLVSRDPAKIGPAIGRYLFVQDVPARRLRRVEAGARVGSRVREVRLPWECGINASPQGELWLACGHAVYRLRPEHMVLRAVEGLPPAEWAVPDGEGRVWIRNGNRQRVAQALRDGRVVEEISGIYLINGAARGTNGQVWVWYRTKVKGWPDGVEFVVTAGASLVDRRGHLWLAVLRENQLREVVPEGWEQWNDAEFGATPVQVFRNARGELIAVTEGRLFRLDELSRRWSPLSEESRRYAYVLPLPGGEMLASVRDYGVVRLTAEGRLMRRLPPSEHRLIQDDFRVLGRGPDGQVWAGNKKGLFRLEGDRLEPVRLPGVKDIGYVKNVEQVVEGHPLQEIHAVDMATDAQGRLWLGDVAGLVQLRSDGTWRHREIEPPIAEVRSFSFGKDGDIWVANRRKRYFSRVKDGKETRYAVEQGYGPEDTHFLKTDRRGWVWRGTRRGVYVSDGKAQLAEDWLFVDTGDECMQYGFFEDRDGSVWIAGTNRIVHVQPSGDWFATRPGVPLVTQGLPEVLDPPRRWTVEFAKLPDAGEWPEPFRYRVLPLFADWRVARGGLAEVPDLANGRYVLEVRQMGLAGVWRQGFRVGPLPLGSWWWMLLPVLAAGAYRWRAWLEYRWRKSWFLLRRWRNGAPASGASDWTGQVLAGRYRLDRRLSPGGFSEVYAAFDERERRPVAVKVMEQRSGDGAWVRARFAQELTALRAVSHPGVITLLDSWIQPTGELCLVTPLIAGRTLREALTGEPWPPRRAATVVRALGDALTAIHEAGIVHRDVKPENILLRQDGTPVLIDFGTSGLLGSQEEPAVTKVLTGTIEYLAPERLTGHYSAGSDLYSFAVVVFELLTGKKLADTGLVVSAERLGERLGGVPGTGEVSGLLAKALQPKPEDRPGEVRAWANRLAGALEGPG